MPYLQCVVIQLRYLLKISQGWYYSDDSAHGEHSYMSCTLPFYWKVLQKLCNSLRVSVYVAKSLQYKYYQCLSPPLLYRGSEWRRIQSVS